MNRPTKLKAHPHISPRKVASTRLHLSPHQRSPGYAQRLVTTRSAKQQISGPAAPAHVDHSSEGKTTEGEGGLQDKDSSPVQPPRSAPKVESLADSAETLCGLTASEDDQEIAGDEKGGIEIAHEMHMASTASGQSHSAMATGEQPVVQKSEADRQVASADSHAASDATFTSDSNSEVEAIKDVSQNSTQNTSIDEEVTMRPKYMALRKETIAKAVSSTKHSITRLFTVKSSGASADGGQRPVFWAQMLACFRGAQPLSPKAAPEKIPSDPAQGKALAGLAHADSMLDQEQWRIGTHMEPEVCILLAHGCSYAAPLACMEACMCDE